MIIGITIGVWDILHNGHINFLKEAKKHCDYLIVGIMTDYWIRVQKGHEKRPYQSLELRYTNLISFNNDSEKIFDKLIIVDTLDISQYLQICDVWIKGEDQKNMKPFDFKNIIIIKRTPGISTTSLINK